MLLLVFFAGHIPPGGPGSAAAWSATLPQAAADDTETARLPDVPGSDPPELTPAAREAIRKGLAFLAATQNRDGSWRTDGSSGKYPVAMTSLAGLALLAAGNTPTQGPYARNVSGAVTYLLKSARRDGLIAQLEEEGHCMHGHGFALLFLAQCYGMEENAQRQAEIRQVLQRGVELTARSQSAAGGWFYTPDAATDEGSVTVTQVQGLRACRNAGIAVPKRAIDNAMGYLERSANQDGGIRYRISDLRGSRPPLTAAAVACWFNAGRYDDPLARKALAYVEQRLRPGRLGGIDAAGHYFYAHLYMAQVMYLAGEEKWQDYCPEMYKALVRQQNGDGSWDGDYVGSAYGTAVALVILQLPYKHLPIMQR